MSSRKRRDDWLSKDEYPDEADMDRFGDDSPGDYDPRTIWRVRGVNTSFWTRTRIVIAVVVFILLVSFVVAEILPLIRG